MKVVVEDDTMLSLGSSPRSRPLYTGEERMREPCSTDTRLQEDGSESLEIHVGSPKQASVEVWGFAI